MVKSGRPQSRSRSCLLIVAALILIGMPAFAADASTKDSEPKFDWSAYLQGTTDYIFRGISQIAREPTPQGGADASYGLFYIGTFISGVDFQDRFAPAVNNLNSIAEVDLYGGVRPKAGGYTFDLGLVAYTYPGTAVHHPFTYDPTYVEFKASVSTTVLKDLALSGTGFVSPNYFGETGPAVMLEGTGSKPLKTFGDFAIAGSGTIGHVFFTRDLAPPVVTTPSTAAVASPLYSYTYWNIGLTATYKSQFSLDLRLWDTDLETGKLPCGTDTSFFQCGPAFVTTVKVLF